MTMPSKRTLMRAMALLTLLLAGSAHALMPPHVTGTNIKAGTLTGNTLIVRGYSLQHASPKRALRVTRLLSKTPLKVRSTLHCKSVGDCGPDAPPGACQERCEVHAILVDTQPGDRLEMSFIDTRIQFQMGPAK